MGNKLLNSLTFTLKYLNILNKNKEDTQGVATACFTDAFVIFVLKTRF